jgi:hypothetical protein
VKAVIIDIDSPGGTTAGSEAIYEAIRKIAAKKAGRVGHGHHRRVRRFTSPPLLPTTSSPAATPSPARSA